MSPARWPWFTLGLVAAALATAALPGQGAELAWQPGGGRWRLATCQLAHWDADHLRWDALAVAILGCWCEMRWPAAARVAIAIALPAVPLAIAILHPGLAFRGLSGVACAIAACGAILAIAEARRAHDGPALLVGAALLAGLAAKCAWELATGSTLFAAARGWTPLPTAHLAGLAVGAGVALIAVRFPSHPLHPTRSSHA